uniref:Telomerase ribonucleoprotein complex - RNA-binding domain-containing protein n=1 Tax=Panagrolaimus sp. ES5 TaxID=591445 RepID=A0AC34FXR3_9BILA
IRKDKEMGKTRNRKKCKRSKKVKEDINVEVISRKWITQDGTNFCRRKEGNVNLDNVINDSKKLLFEMFTKENADAFVRASKSDSRCQIFMKEFFGYTSQVCKRWKLFKIGKSLNKTVPKLVNSTVIDQVDNSVSYCQLRAFMKDVMHFLFNDFLLGERNTQRFINKMAYSFFNIRRDEPVFLENYILRNIELTKVAWLQRFSFKTARILLQCVIKFLCDFFQQLIHKTFHTVFDNVDKMRFYRIEIWKRLTAVFLEKFIQSRQAKELQLLPNDHYYLMW